jgi:branched-chain amino acid transport system permease protein
VGGYGAAIAVNSWGLWLPWAVLVGIAASILLALLLGIPTLRLRGDYLAIVTIAAAEILRIIANSTKVQSVTGGPQGIGGFANWFFERNPFAKGRYGFGTITYDQRQLWVTTVTWTLVALASVLVALLVHSPWGRVVRAIREDEDAVRSLGKNAYSYKMQALVLGGAIGGVAGIMLVFDQQFIQPDLFQSAITFYAFAALILGGTGRIFGPILGAITFWFLVEGADSFLGHAADNNFLGVGHLIDTTQIGTFRFVLVGLIIMLLLVFRPQGILGSRQEVMLGDQQR